MKGAFDKKRKIFNDPIYGFISIPDSLLFDLIEHPFFQRLRRIKQLGLTHLVYPGALHTRFHHAIGAMNLMSEAVEVLRYKGHEITNEEARAVTAAILLHDIGHGPYSHALEHSIVDGVTHEDISALFMERLNSELKGELDLSMHIFKNEYHKSFLHQLVSSQLDMDRLDYLKRDSFYTGVSEGVISSDRIIKMLNVSDDKLAIELKGIYSIEKFIIARRLMYWQVYLHKTVVSAEFLLIKILKRARELAEGGTELFATPAFKYFLQTPTDKESFKSSTAPLESFALLDDFDIFTSIKVWVNNTDPILSNLCKSMVYRKLNRVEIKNTPFDPHYVEAISAKAKAKFNTSESETSYFVYTDTIENSAYLPNIDHINILYDDGKIVDIAEAADQLNISVLSEPVVKYFLSYPKDCEVTAETK